MFIKSFIVYYISYLLRIIKNIIPKQDLKHKIHRMQNYFMMQRYNLVNVFDYSKAKGLNNNAYDTKLSKVYVLNDFYLNVYKMCTLMHDNENNVLLDCFPYDGKDLHKHLMYDEFIDIKVANPVIIDEAVNFALKWDDNYWHFTFSVIGKLLAFEQNGFSGKYILFDRPFIRQLVKLLDIPNDKFIFVTANECYKVKKLHVVREYYSCDFTTIDQVKDLICSNIDNFDLSEYPKKLYIRRIGKYNRQVENEKEILDLLESLGFKAIFPDDYSVIEQIKYFHAADVIVCPHGGCSTNALYMRADTHFIECFSYTYLNPCMLQVVKNIGIFYNMIVERECTKIDKSANFKIDYWMLYATIYKFIS